MSFYTRFAAHYEQVFPFRPATLAFLRDRLPDRGRILDLGCGTGHYAGALAAAGFDAIGVDLDTDMIGAARKRYAAARFVVSDLAEIADFADRADGAFCIGNVLPHLAPAALDRFLAALAAVLPPGAPWVVQTVNFDRLLPLDEPFDFPPLVPEPGLEFRRRYEPAPDGRVVFRTSLWRDGEQLFEGEADLWPLTSDDLAACHGESGFDLVEQAGGFDGAPFSARQSGGCVQVYRRPGA